MGRRLVLAHGLLAAGVLLSACQGSTYSTAPDGGSGAVDGDAPSLDGSPSDGSPSDGAVARDGGGLLSDGGSSGTDGAAVRDGGPSGSDSGSGAEDAGGPVDAGPMCGNGTVETGETCDPPSSCPATCDDGMACTTDTRSGSEATCDVECSHSTITACAGGDGCCPSGCNVTTDDDCLPACGDGVCTSGETCGSCAADCGACVCGDGMCTVSAGELCTSCSADCDTRSTTCGNGECQSGETSASCEADCGPASWPTGWADWETQVVSLFNMHRAAGTDCPSGPKSPVGSVSMESALRTASRLHSWDQSYSDYFSHTSCNGRTFTERASAQGTSAYGEIIARGQSSPSSAVDAWMASTTGHCDIIMNGSYTRVGVGYAQASGGARLWTGMFR